MFKLALHWQILIGMVVGAAVGTGLNLFAGTTTTTLSEGLPAGLSSPSRKRCSTSSGTAQGLENALRPKICGLVSCAGSYASQEGDPTINSPSWMASARVRQ